MQIDYLKYCNYMRYLYLLNLICTVLTAVTYFNNKIFILVNSVHSGQLQQKIEHTDKNTSDRITKNKT